MDAKYYRYKWADAEIMKKDKQNPLRNDAHKISKENMKALTRLMDNINIL